MSKRVSKKTLFNKNHITITKDINVKNEVSCVVVRNAYTCHCPYQTKRTCKNIKCESPLGFYYMKKVYENNNNDSDYIRVFEIFLPSETYTITYVLTSNMNHVSQTLRPWEVYEDEKSMSDHFILALKQEIDNILSIIEENKLTIKSNNVQYNLKWLKDIMYTELFGNTKGIRFQTDKEKILSHGFDLKTSFRK